MGGGLRRTRRAVALALALGALAVCASTASATVGFSVTVSPQSVKFPGDHTLTYIVSAHAGPATERFSILPQVAVAGYGPAIRQTGPATLAGPGILGGKAERIQSVRCTALDRGYRAATAYRQNVGIAPNSTIALSFPFRVTRPAWPSLGMAPDFNISNTMVGTAFGAGTLPGPGVVDALDPIRSGQRGVQISLRTRPRTFQFNTDRQARLHRGPIALFGRIAPKLGNKQVRLWARAKVKDRKARRAQRRRHVIGTVRTDSSGHFTFRGFKPILPGSYEVGAELVSHNRTFAGSFSCGRQFTLVK